MPKEPPNFRCKCGNAAKVGEPAHKCWVCYWRAMGCLEKKIKYDCIPEDENEETENENEQS